MNVIAHQVDTVDLLCQRHLGATGGIVEAVLAQNPGLSAIGPVLPHGTAVTLPDAAPDPVAQTDIVHLWD
jgi:phage tail protein X